LRLNLIGELADAVQQIHTAVFTATPPQNLMDCIVCGPSTNVRCDPNLESLVLEEYLAVKKSWEYLKAKYEMTDIFFKLLYYSINTLGIT
jgi:hypothetical protein